MIERAARLGSVYTKMFRQLFGFTARMICKQRYEVLIQKNPTDVLSVVDLSTSHAKEKTGEKSTLLVSKGC